MTLTHAHLQDSSTPLTTSLNWKWSPGDCGQEVALEREVFLLW